MCVQQIRNILRRCSLQLFPHIRMAGLATLFATRMLLLQHVSCTAFVAAAGRITQCAHYVLKRLLVSSQLLARSPLHVLGDAPIAS
jgi:hypothetical protein